MTVSACAALVEAGDPVRFAATMAAPVPVRARLWPLYAYNLEIARAPWASSEPLIAEMRLRWWIDSIGAMGQGLIHPGHDVTAALAPLLAQKADLLPLLIGMAEARRWEVWQEPFGDAGALHAHLDGTAGNLMWAAALVLGAPAMCEPVVRSFGNAAGLAAWLCAVPALEAHGRTPLPNRLPETIRALARDAIREIDHARRQRRSVPKHVAGALWPGWQSRRLLALAAADPRRVGNGTLAVPEFIRRGTLLLHALRGTW